MEKKLKNSKDIFDWWKCRNHFLCFTFGQNQSSQVSVLIILQIIDQTFKLVETIGTHICKYKTALKFQAIIEENDIERVEGITSYH